MATYKINGKDYELQMTNTEGDFRQPTIEIALIAADGERIGVFKQNCANIDGSPEWDYAGGGKFWSECSIDGNTVTPKPGAVKITPEEYINKIALESAVCAVETECNFPSSRECENRINLIDEASSWLLGQYKDMIAEGVEQWTEARLAEEGGAE